MSETCSAAVTDIGERPTNEDAVYTFERDSTPSQSVYGRLYMVADGVGGKDGGQTASNLAIKIVAESYYDSPGGDSGVNLVSAVKTAHSILYTLAGQIPSWQAISTTLVAALIHEDCAHIVHAGDSRAYCVRDGVTEQLTQDDVWEEADDNHGALTLWLGGGLRPEIEPKLRQYPLQPGDVIILASDGLNALDPAEFPTVVSKYPVRQAAERLVTLARQCGATDNTSVVVIRYGDQSVEELAARRKTRPMGLLLVSVAVLIFLLIGLSRSNGEMRGPAPTLPSGQQSTFVSPTVTMEPSPSATPSPAPTLVTTTPIPPTSTRQPPSVTPIPSRSYSATPAATLSLQTTQACESPRILVDGQCDCPRGTTFNGKSCIDKEPPEPRRDRTPTALP